MISSIIQREFMGVTSITNIAWTPCEDSLFKKFIKKSCSPCNILELEETYYGLNDISIVICNNRVTHIDKAIALAKFLLCPLLIIDHSPRSNIITKEANMDIPISPVYQIAISKNIHSSWNKIQNTVMEYDINKPEYIKIWKNLIFQLCKSNMVVKDEQIIKINEE